MSKYYTEVNQYGIVTRSQFTTNPLTPVIEGYRLLPDDPPNPPAYSPGFTKAVRVEPVPADATAIVYDIVEDPAPAMSEEQKQLMREMIVRSM